MQRRTKIVATLVLATDSPEKISQLIQAGANVVRLNFSHWSAEDHERRATMVREAAAKLGRFVAILGDLQGPKIRIARFVDSKIHLNLGDTFVLDAGLDKASGNQQAVGIDYENITKGDYVNAQGGTNTMKIVRVGDVIQ